MGAEINKNIYKKKRRFLIQTGNKVLTGDFFYPDGRVQKETRNMPMFEMFVQVICDTRLECVQILSIIEFKYTAIHEVVEGLSIDGVAMHTGMFIDVPNYLKN